MRSKLYTAVVALAHVLALVPRSAQAEPFVNLNFEQATVPPGTPPGFVPAAQGFPGWTPRIGDSVQSSVAYNFTGIGEGEVVLFDMPLGIGAGVPEPRFAACLITDFGFNLTASLAQVGDVPVEAQSLRLLSDSFRPPAIVQINSLELPLVRLSAVGTFPVEYGADITSFAGQTVELRLSSGVLGSFPVRIVDALSFSSSPIPEPSVMGIWLMVLVSATAQRVLRR